MKRMKKTEEEEDGFFETVGKTVVLAGAAAIAFGIYNWMVGTEDTEDNEARIPRNNSVTSSSSQNCNNSSVYQRNRETNLSTNQSLLPLNHNTNHSSSASSNSSELANTSSHDLCIVCEDAVRDIVFSPCGHLVCCNHCTILLLNQSEKCPICRIEIQSSLKVYKS